MRIETEPTCGRRGYLVAVIATALALALPARALVVDGDPELEQRAPGRDTGFEHVGKIGGTTGVYLGGGWVLTAAHVGAGPLALDGSSYPAVPGSWVALRGAGSAKIPDLGLFRVDPRPTLPDLAIARRGPRTGEPVLLVGCGHGRGERIEWEGRSGFRWVSPNVRRWGINRVAATAHEMPTPGASTWMFSTLFSVGDRQEAHAALGDSGGAGFLKRRGAWMLAGIIVSVSSFPGQPPQTAISGNTTHLADLSRYRGEILSLTGLEGAEPAAHGGP
jgi:hypothetical protein